MTRNPLFNERHSVYSPSYWREELVRMRDLVARVEEYGGIDRLRADIRSLAHELAITPDETVHWARLSIAAT